MSRRASDIKEKRISQVKPRSPRRERLRGASLRRRRRLRNGGASIGVNLAPMIDVTFLLLIFFLVTTTFERAEGILASDLPEVSDAAAVPLPISPIVVRLSQTGQAHGEYAIAIDGFDDCPQDVSLLPEFLRLIQRQPGFDDETPVVIIGENDVRWDHLVGCWNAALRAGCKRIAFGQP